MGRISCAAAMVAGMCAFSIAQAQAPEQGKAIFESRCLACHSLTTNRVGPALGTVVGRVAGTYPGFNYSPALKSAGHIWNAEKIERWLANPQAFVPGAIMPFRLGDAEERRQVAAYLASLKH